MCALQTIKVNDLPQKMQAVLLKMPYQYWPQEYRMYASALGVCTRDSDSESETDPNEMLVRAHQLPVGTSRGASEHVVCTAVNNAMAVDASDSDADDDKELAGAPEHVPASPYDFGEQRISQTNNMMTRRGVTEEELQDMRMILIQQLTAMRDKGDFQHFSDCLSVGQKGMKHYMKIDGEHLYIKTGGDWMQTLWLNMHTTDHADVFNIATAQASFSRWIGLPHLLHDAELATNIERWKEHSLADHNEAVTAVLPPEELHLYCELQLAYFRLYGQVDDSQTKCAWTEGHGVHKTKCFKNRAWDTRFCRKHYWEVMKLQKERTLA